MEFPQFVRSLPESTAAPRNHHGVCRVFIGELSQGGRLRLLSACAVSNASASALSTLWDGGAAVLLTASGYSLNLSRKIVHVSSGLLYLASWPFFSSSSEARYFAAVVPLLNCIRLLVHGHSIVANGLIKSVTREGKPEELLRGPLFYVLALMISALIFWRESPVGIIAVAMMSGGDGFADIVGRKHGSLKLPHNRGKSWIGSFSMFLFGFVSSIMMLYYFSALGCIHLDWKRTVEKVFMISFAAAIVESLPISEVIDDNITVPVASMLAACLAFGS